MADALLLLRPELQPWSFNCLVDHGWAGNAFDCASQRRNTARVAGLVRSWVKCEGPYSTMTAEDDTIEALAQLFHKDDDDD